MRVLVLGAGFGGLELTTRLSDALGDDVEIVLIDQADSFVFGFSKLDVMFGRTVATAVRHPYRDVVKPGVRFVQTTVRSIDPTARRVETDAGRVRCRRDGRRTGCRPRSVGDAGTGRRRPRVLHGRRRVRDARCARAVSRRARDRRRHLDAVQVPARAERDRVVGARLPDRARAARTIGSGVGHASAGADPAIPRRVGGADRCVRGTQHRVASEPARARARSGPKDRVARRRRGDAVRLVPRCARAPRAGRRAGVGPLRRRLDSRRTR